MLQQTGAAFAAEARSRANKPMILCDLTQSYSPAGGGGISTYLREKRDYVLRETPHHLLQIVPGPEDRVTVNGRHIFAEVGADPVHGSPNYRFILRTGVVRDLLAQYRPDVIESLCPWVLPWTAIHHRRAFPDTTLIAGYRTDFPNAHVYRVGAEKLGETIGRGLRWLSYGYAEITYREFDWVYTLSEAAREPLGKRGIHQTSVLPLGVDTTLFNPGRRDPGYRAELGLPGDGPLLVYAGRIDNEKRADRLVDMFRRLPRSLGAALVMIGDGKLREPLAAAAADLPIAFTGFEKDRAELARALASSDIYVSAMADETFGVSVLEAQAAGLPVVGVTGGAMPDRVPAGLGMLGPVDDVAAMARNVEAVWAGDAAGMGRAARDVVVAGFGWDRTFERLLGEIYPAAMAVSADRVARRTANRFASARPSLPAGLVTA
ncbi:glycosyltransferase [Sphingomonas yantingensis]|uniref:Alpha-1,6-mannosyltransferase n=1 Tax=Sphingomonas yantingensis TaxID=1241761 RepID=A0A7W9AQ40_9SPHN|nr:glycosyltransferase [Sphingomonas yantingensis]MBB5698314.1 alpha-1,6-mannosyltransferase [Sphingomonas yantingensis]